MKRWAVAMGMTAAMAAGTAGAADKAKAKDAASPRGSSVGSRHHSGSGSSSRPAGEQGASAVSKPAPPTAAQLRHPRAGTGSGHRHRYGHHRYGHRNRGWSYYDPWYSYGWYGWYSRPYGWHAPYSGAGYYGYQPYPHRYGYSAHRAGSLRVLVKPSETKVYVDGYYAGIADDFDGLFQRLHVAPGRHDIDLRLEGYRTQTFKVYVPYDSTIKLHHRMVRGAGEDVTDEQPGQPVPRARYEDDEDEDRYEPAGRDRDRDYDLAGERGLIRLDVRPDDASIYVDGAFRGTGRELRRLRLTPGRHRIEVVRPGYRTLERDVEVRRGETLDLAVDLERS